MANFIIIVIVIGILAFAVYSSVKHFKGQGGCCGGSNYKPKIKKLPHIIYKKTFLIGGMQCEHCKNRIEEVVNDIKSISGKVNLKKSELVVSYAENVDDELIKSHIEKVGYTVLEIK